MLSQPHQDLVGQLKTIYHTHRTAALNKKYYGVRLYNFKRRNVYTEWTIAVGVTGSSVSGWALWGIEPWVYLWGAVAGASSLLAIGKPILKYSDEIERYTKLFEGYSRVFTRLDRMVDEIVSTHKIALDLRVTYNDALDLIEELAPLDDPKVDEKLRLKCFDEVLTEIPVQRYWVPA